MDGRSIGERWWPGKEIGRGTKGPLTRVRVGGRLAHPAARSGKQAIRFTGIAPFTCSLANPVHRDNRKGNVPEPSNHPKDKPSVTKPQPLGKQALATPGCLHSTELSKNDNTPAEPTNCSVKKKTYENIPHAESKPNRSR